MIKLTISTLLLFSSLTSISAQTAAEDSYAIETGVKGVVDLYDLSSVVRTPLGFSILDVVTAKHFPHIFGPTAYRVNRETYRCGNGTYDITSVTEYSSDGGLIHSLKDAPQGAMQVVAGTASSEMYNRFCPAALAGQLRGLASAGIVSARTPYDAYHIGRDLLANSSEE